jgi:uncharacterized protein YbbC (DUF1343 family)
MIRTGLDVLLDDPTRLLAGERVGLLTNATAVDRSLRHATELMAHHPDVDLRLLLAPEHGLWGQAQDMAAVASTSDPATGLPVISLYGTSESSLTPTTAQLAGLDVLVCDLQDIGCRYYTFGASMALCLRACARDHKRMVILDRPNPIGGTEMEGGGVAAGLESLVGLYPAPQRHGLTLAELARLYNTEFGIGADLEVVACDGWCRDSYFENTGLPWIMPSPNMPTVDTAFVYPGLCLLEATNVSEGRGTTRPFELFGAPFVDGRRLAETLSRYALLGVTFRPCFIQPTFHKHAGQSCGAVQVHVTDRRTFRPYRTGLAVLHALRTLWPGALAWRDTPYEFRRDVPAIDLLTGSAAVREAIDAGAPFDDLVATALAGSERFSGARPAALLY